MSKSTCKYIIFVLMLFAGYLLLLPDRSICKENNRIAVIISKRIRPYLDILDGINSEMTDNSNKIELFFLSDSDNNKKIYIQLLSKEYDLCVAIGPEAAKLIWPVNEKLKTLKLYTAVLDPDTIIKNNPEACGISLRIPVAIQTLEIARSFPEIKSIGLIFDADHNQWFYKKAAKAAINNGIKIIPLCIKSKGQIPKIIKDNWKRIDCIWMIPDRTIISEKIIQYIIKQGIYNGKGVIGYNSFFIKSGAFFAFEFNYKKLGIQTGKKIKSYLGNGICNPESPLFNKIVNHKMVFKIGIRIKKQ